MMEVSVGGLLVTRAACSDVHSPKRKPQSSRRFSGALKCKSNSEHPGSAVVARRRAQSTLVCSSLNGGPFGLGDFNEADNWIASVRTYAQASRAIDISWVV